ncbi:MAG: hypothetical protein QM775_25060 [Pirellulales bacterium]
MRVRVVDGEAVHECGLCGARFGGRRAVEALTTAEQARARGVATGIWPLVRVLERLTGLCVRGAAAADAGSRTLPFVELGAVTPAALVQLENLVKALRLHAGALRRHWIVEVEYQHHLAFVLKPRHEGGAVAMDSVRDAAIDADLLADLLDRDTRLSWWRHADGPASG